MPRKSGNTASQFSATDAERVLQIACGTAGISCDGATLIRLGENAIFRLPGDRIVVRIARTLSYWDDAKNEVEVARWLADQKISAAEVHEVAQPIAADGHPVTFWQFIDGREGDRTDTGTLGTVLRTLHKLPRPDSFELPNENILGRVQSRVEVAPVPSQDKDFLLARLEELRGELSALKFPLEPAPTHGDAHTGNLMICANQPVLIDFERFAWGQPEWDLAVSATSYQTAGWLTEREYNTFTEAYGYDVMSWHEGFETLRSVHELKMTTWLMQNVNESADAATEYQVRMKTIRGDRSQSWRAF
ncbi:MAG: Aminoglycoside phosphotransferase [Amycolatopsis sp.]|uniref:aminoglycoside phosphotransferase family protein n=1 Tax=Amycolatopsis sp. TaxID=37632 RepID=UPI0026329954|nr:aminoglycoside phosphotransferase family protein [Amycolatopsis sp.]MCU1685757.1 Aminoglycoside phosphotransferase [Amycolatopsis sp.]